MLASAWARLPYTVMSNLGVIPVGEEMWQSSEFMGILPQKTDEGVAQMNKWGFSGL